MKHIDRKTKIIISVLFPILIIAWNMGFDLGAFGTVLYRNIMNAWIFSLSTFCALLYFRWSKKISVKKSVLFIILIPVIWPLVDYLDQHINIHYFRGLVMLYYLFMTVSLGFVLYIFLKLIKYDIFEPLNRKNLGFIVISVLFVTFMGYQVGAHNYLFLACGHFRVSGEYIPSNCYLHPTPTFETFYKKSLIQ